MTMTSDNHVIWLLAPWNELWEGDNLVPRAFSFSKTRLAGLEVWRHKKIMGFVRIFWKNNVQEAYLPKMSISGQIVSEMLAGYTQKTPYKPF